MTPEQPGSAAPVAGFRSRYAVWAIAWLLTVVGVATQWFVYDASRGVASPLLFYLWWSGYMAAVLVPTAAWLAWRLPIRRPNVGRAVLVHLAAAVALIAAQLTVESFLGWRHHANLATSDALRHYFSQHSQIYLTTYWLIVAGVVYVRTRADAAAATMRATALKAQLADARMEVLRRQLQPHFLFNTLQAAIELVHVDPDGAEDVLLGLSELLRAVLEEIRSDEIPLNREFKLLRDYMRIQERRFQGRLRFDMRMDPELGECRVPPLLLQPLVENAVRHGVGEHRDADTITVAAMRRGDIVELTVTNQTGALGVRGGTTGVGLAVTRERLNQLYGPGRSSVALSALDPSGVRASVSLPFSAMQDTERCATTAGRS